MTNSFLLKTTCLKNKRFSSDYALTDFFSKLKVYAWGPSRKTFTKRRPADYVTFNSITDSDFGDERNFVIAKGVNESSSSWRDKIEVTEDGEYYIKIYIHNNAADNLKLISINTRIVSLVPQFEYVTRVQINAIISSDNANPKEVWDQCIFDSDIPFKISYVPSSARYHNNINPKLGFKLSDSIVDGKSGVLIGYKDEGEVPGCYQYSGYVIYKVKVAVRK